MRSLLQRVWLRFCFVLWHPDHFTKVEVFCIKKLKHMVKKQCIYVNDSGNLKFLHEKSTLKRVTLLSQLTRVTNNMVSKRKIEYGMDAVLYIYTKHLVYTSRFYMVYCDISDIQNVFFPKVALSSWSDLNSVIRLCWCCHC